MTARALTVTHDALHRAFDGQPVRIIVRDGEPWFVASDVARVLEIPTSDGGVRVVPELRITQLGVARAIARLSAGDLEVAS